MIQLPGTFLRRHGGQELVHEANGFAAAGRWAFLGRNLEIETDRLRSVGCVPLVNIFNMYTVGKNINTSPILVKCPGFLTVSTCLQPESCWSSRSRCVSSLIRFPNLDEGNIHKYVNIYICIDTRRYVRIYIHAYIYIYTLYICMYV